MKIKGTFIAIILIGVLFSFNTEKPLYTSKAQIALCVDFSKSTKEIANSVRDNLYELYVEYGEKKPTTKLEVAIIGYSSKAFGKKNGYVKILSDFGDDPQEYLELVTTKRLASSMADNYVGRAINLATNKLKWDQSKAVKKQIFALGNGPISDDYSEAKNACKKAKKKNILVHVLYIVHKARDNNYDYWKHLTQLSGGKIKVIVSQYLTEKLKGEIRTNIQRISDESAMMNSTYIPYGPQGKIKLNQLKTLDTLARHHGVKVNGIRALYKSSPYYQNKQSSWDLVDLFKKGNLNFNTINKSTLPSYMQNMTVVELKSILKQKVDERQGYLDVIKLLDYSNRQIKMGQPEVPAYKLDLSSTILKLFSESGS